jgi:hypothetical protein
LLCRRLKDLMEVCASRTIESLKRKRNGGVLRARPSR